MTGSNLHIAWARLFASALADAGVAEAIVSPGSRSTPLALAFGQEKRFRTQVVIDERSAAFFALGQARATGRPSVLLCTSGTAAAHYFPAVIEAARSALPMVVVTADRPWELQDAGASQTVDQLKLFGAHARHFAQLGVPDPAALRAVPRIAAQAVAASLGPNPGPVHVNASFRKPLEPQADSAPEPWTAELDRLLEKGAPVVHPAAETISDEAVRRLVAACEGRSRGLVICGPAPAHGDLRAAREAAAGFARATGFPLCAEATSQLRFGLPDAPQCGAFDTLLRDRAFTDAHLPELIVEIGATPTSSSYAAFLDRCPGARRLVLSESGWNDPRGDASELFLGDPYELLREAARHLHAPAAASAWASEFTRADTRAWDRVRAELEGPALTEGRIAHDLVELLPEGAALAVSNSLPVRDLDTFAPPSRRSLAVLHQRGASGIDGLLSGAAGARSVLPAPLALLVGDLAFQHDLGGLAQVAAVPGPLAIVVVQNGGGRIFEHLPVARGASGDALERFFVTPQACEIGAAARAFGVAHRRIETAGAFRSAVEEALQADAPVVIEACVPPHDGAERRARIWGTR